MNSQTNPAGQDDTSAVIQNDPSGQLQLAEKQRQALQAELDTLRERFTYVLKATQDAVWDWDLVKNVAWYSEGLKLLFGHDPRHLADGVKFWQNTIHPHDKERVINGIHAAIDHGVQNWHDRYRFKRADGSYAWVLDRGYVIINNEGKPVRMVGSMQDITAEVEARAALRESEEKFRGAFDNAAIGVSITTPQGQFLSVNKAYPKIFGYSEAELTSKKISDLSHPDELEADRKILDDLLCGRTQVSAREKRYLHKSGKIVWGRVFGTVICDAQGVAKYIIGVLEDITEQRQSLLALRENEERLRLVIDSASIGTWDFDPRTGKLFWDDRCKAMFGLAPEDYVDYEVFLKGVHPDDRQAADEANQNAIKGIGNGDYNIEYRTIGLRDGKQRCVRAKGRSYKDENGVTVRYAGTVIDITEEKNQAQRVREQEERFRLLATSIPQIVWTTDNEGFVDYISDKWQSYTGQPPSYEKFSFRGLMHPDDLQRVIPVWNQCLKQGITYQGEYRLKNIHTNEYRWFSCTTLPLKDRSGNVIKWVGSATDIHDQKMIEMRLENKVAERTQELTDLNRQLERSNAELEQYAYVTSHDLKEPLRKIRTYSGLITAQHLTHLPPVVVEYLGKIESASSRMSGLIDDLLQYSRVSHPEDSIQLVDLNNIVAQIGAEFEYVLKDKIISVEAGTLPVIKAVRIQMHQLFFNLFSNAIKFSKPRNPNKISITCSVLPEQEKATHLSLTAPGRYYKIVFKDQGIGFSPAYSEKVFTIFNRLNNPKQYEGHGIGLALCRKIVNSHHGTISAHGEENKGAVFTIILPEGSGDLNFA